MITHVAIRWNGNIYSLPAPNRHHHVIWMIVEQTGVSAVQVDMKEDQGFLDEVGQYYNRKDALTHALINGQVKEPSQVRMEMLHSEDVW